MSFTIEIDNAAVLEAFNRLIQAGTDMSPVLRAIGEDIATRAKARFETSTAPDGTPWAPNSPVTYALMVDGFGKHRPGFSKSNFGKSGRVNARGGARLAGKKPLIGESRDLSRQIDYAVSGNSVTVFSTPLYAAMQQFGGTKAKFPHLLGDIPARPFLPVTANDELYPDEEREVLEVLRKALESSMKA